MPAGSTSAFERFFGIRSYGMGRPPVVCEIQSATVSCNEFQTVGAEQRKARLAKSVHGERLVQYSGMADERSVLSLTRALR